MLSSSEILLELRSFRATGRMLYVAAHPDDENTRLITYFSRALGFAAGYLSLTRGDGGQNLIGPELHDGLGAIRTHELLAARALDGGQQFFARAVDFGFCKDYREALRIWHRDDVLADTVRVIRMFQPDVIVTRFAPEPGGTHGHHTASTILALEAFEAAADPARFPDQLATLAPWRTARLFWNIFQPPMPGAKKVPIPEGSLELDVGAWLPLAGRSVGEIATRSRTMHKSQGMGAVASRGVTLEHFKQLAGEPARKDMFEGIDTTWARLPGGAAIGAEADAILAAFDPLRPAASVPALLALRARVHALPDGRVIREKAALLDRVIVACLGLHVETLVPSAEVVPGETLALRHVALARGGFPVRWLGVRAGPAAELAGSPIALEPNVPAVREAARMLPPETPMTQPFWLAEPGTPGMFTVTDPALIGLPESGPAYPVVHAFDVGGQTLELADGPVQVHADQVKGEIRTSLRAIPPVSLDFVRPLELFAPGATRAIELELTAARPELRGPVRLDAPPGWTVAPAVQDVALAAPGERVRVAFTLTAPRAPSVARIGACVAIGGVEYKRRRQDIRHDHIPALILQPAASLRAVCLQLAIRGQRVGYLPGAADGVDASLARMGWEVVRLGDADLTPEGLSGLQAVVLGIRAFNTRPGIVPRLTGLFQWVAEGGTVLVQYCTNHALVTTRIAPVPLNLSRERITDETSAITLLDPRHPAFAGPNPIGASDFEGWVQERGLNFADAWDPALQPLLSMADPGEAPKQGGLLAMRHGRGWWVYTGLSFFRQLPAGVPGAYRLFANLVSLGPDGAA